jgi:hypothetical protein
MSKKRSKMAGDETDGSGDDEVEAFPSDGYDGNVVDFGDTGSAPITGRFVHDHTTRFDSGTPYRRVCFTTAGG